MNTNTQNRFSPFLSALMIIICLLVSTTIANAQDTSNQAKRVIQNKRVKIEIYDKGGQQDTIVEEIITTSPATQKVEERIITIDQQKLENMSQEELEIYKRKLELEIQKEEAEKQMQMEEMEEELEMEMESKEDALERKMERIEKVLIERFESDGDPNDKSQMRKVKTVEQSWLVLDLGWNVWITENTFDMPEAYQEMELDRGKSVNFHLGIIQQGVNLYKGKLRFVYGLGVEYNNYRFKQNIDLVQDSDPLVYAINTDRDYKKNKLVSLHATMPLMLNFKSDPRNEDEAFKLAAGIQLGYLMSSHIKQKWGEDGRKEKKKVKGDYAMQDYRIGYVVQFGYGDLNIFGKYYPTSVFKEGRGPVANTACVGLVLTPF